MKNISSLFTSSHEISFNHLMQCRIHKVLLICSSYDAFMLEEDGRIDEQLFDEYSSLNLRHSPIFMHVDSSEEALQALSTTNFDLVITMLSVGGTDVFKFSKVLKTQYPDIPVVVLTPFSREVSLFLSKEDTSSIDYVFCWLGNADIMLAIIKLIEDSMNAAFDVLEVGVQAILLVEDSVRFYSSYLPLIYRLVLSQSRNFMDEGLNDHHRGLRMRGRPKILLARNYEEAVHLFDKYQNNLLGVISDVSYLKDGEKVVDAGLELARYIKTKDKYMPFLLQSSDSKWGAVAKALKVSFVSKNDPLLLRSLSDFITTYMAFGDFIFIDPSTHLEVARIKTLKELQQKIYSIPDESLFYHFSRDHVSKWLKARALFSLAKSIKNLRVASLDDIQHTKVAVCEFINSFRSMKGRGVIAKFYREDFDEYASFARIGNGSIGGKARGLAFLNTIINKYYLSEPVADVVLAVPRSVVLSTEVFDEFMNANNLHAFTSAQLSDDEVLKVFVEAELPVYVQEDVLKFCSVLKKPIAIRSSSVLEDSRYQPFAGIYATYMISPSPSLHQTHHQICTAIKCVYASAFYRASKRYAAVIRSVIDEERMGVVLQELVGQAHGDVFYPTFSGVARSVNFYPIGDEKAEEGVVSVAMGLGKHIVEGGASLRFSPVYPKKILQLSSVDLTLKDTQKTFYALDLQPSAFIPSLDDAINFKKMPIKDAEDHGTLRWLGSVYDYRNQIIRDNLLNDGLRLVTFSNILKYDVFPLAPLMRKILAAGQREMNQAIELEFAVDLQVGEGKLPVLYLLQIRPIVENKECVFDDCWAVDKEKLLVYSNSALGNGLVTDVCDVIYIKTKDFSPQYNALIVPIIDTLNKKLEDEQKGYVLIGPGRWGSQDPWLGIPIKWGAISAARLIVETGLDNYRIEPSQGTHFFHNLTSLNVGYFTINPAFETDVLNLSFLDKLPAVYEDEYLRHVRFDKPCIIKMDGKNGNGMVELPDET